MAVAQENIAAESVATDEQTIYCPSCGYDLRGSTSDRCSECGLVVDRNADNASSIAWTHRRRIGRFRAFWKTVWQFTMDGRTIRHELLRNHSDRDARRFMLWNALIVWLALTASFAGFIHAHGWSILAFEDRKLQFYGGQSAIVQDLAVPWSAGVTVSWCVPAGLAGLALYLATLGRAAQRQPARSEALRRRARCISAYASGPLAWLLPAVILVAVTVPALTTQNSSLNPAFNPRFDILTVTGRLIGVLGGALVFVAVVGSLHRSGQWIKRARHGGFGRYLIGIVELLGRTVFGTVMFLGVMPWCVGLWRLMIASQ